MHMTVLVEALQRVAVQFSTISQLSAKFSNCDRSNLYISAATLLFDTVQQRSQIILHISRIPGSGANADMHVAL